MAGNVREWCLNSVGPGKRHAVGGAWNEPTYLFYQTGATDPFSRDPNTGFRCALYPGGAPLKLHAQDLSPKIFNFKTAKDVSDDVFQLLKSSIQHSPEALDPQFVSEEKNSEGNRVEHIRITTAYDEDDLIDIRLEFPAEERESYEAVVFISGINCLIENRMKANPAVEMSDAVPKSGRVIVRPTLSGMWERGGDASYFKLGSDEKFAFRMFQRWQSDMIHLIDYLEMREDINADTLGYMGLSLGSLSAGMIVAMEDRFDFTILVSGGISGQTKQWGELGLFPRVTVPTLMLNGRFDYIFPYETNQVHLAKILGTDPEHVRHVAYDVGHVPLPRFAAMKEIADWLDIYQPID